MQWDYFPNTSAVLVDKIYKFHSTLVELGGEVSVYWCVYVCQWCVSDVCWYVCSMQVSEQVLNPPYWHSNSHTPGTNTGTNANADKQLHIGQSSESNQQVQSVAAAHTTCYEKWNKVTGLKAVNAFWNPFYYDPSIPTITKQLVFTTEREVNTDV